MKTYIIDFFNVFSDYRETHYKKLGIDFHNVKYDNLNNDTVNFFDLFFSHYLRVSNIPESSEFIFVLKKIYNYDTILEDLLKRYKHINIKFVIVNDRYPNSLIEQNKDDFICQYLLSVYADSTLISNDKYKNKRDYTYLFLELNKVNIQIIHLIKDEIVNAYTFYIVDSGITNKINSITFDRTAIPKSKFPLF